MARSALAIAAATLGLIKVTVGQPLPWNARILPSYAPSCAALDTEGRVIPDPSACPSSLACVQDPTRGSYYCGTSGAPCSSDEGCYLPFGGACRAGADGETRCAGGYGEFGDIIFPFEMLCLGRMDMAYSRCGGDGAKCRRGTVEDADAQCESGYCAPNPGPFSELFGTCAPRATEVGARCDRQNACAWSSGVDNLYCRTSDHTCQRVLPEGSDCSADDGRWACDPTTTYCSTIAAAPGLRQKCLVQQTKVGSSCAFDTLHGCDARKGLACRSSPQGPLCVPTGKLEGSSCYGDLSGNACASPRYCTGPNAPPDSTFQCRTKASLGDSCRFDPVNGCRPGLYCTSTDQTCQRLSSSKGETCGPDGNACSAAADLYCVASTQLCEIKTPWVNATCAFDTANGCADTTRDGHAMYCRSSDATCQLRFIDVGADCRADPTSSCGTATAAYGPPIPLFCSNTTYTCRPRVGEGADCASNRQQACLHPDTHYCSSNRNVCVPRVTAEGATCNDDPYGQCGLNPSYAYPGYNGQLYPMIESGKDGNQICYCFRSPGPSAATPPAGAFSRTSVGDDCSSNSEFACGYASAGVKLYCARSTKTCQAHITTTGDSCAFDPRAACGITTDGTFTQLFPSIPAGASGHANCTCVKQDDVDVIPNF